MSLRDFVRKFVDREWHLPRSSKVHRAIEAFGPTERVFFFVFVGIFAASGLTLLWKANQSIMVEIPAHGGTFTEGMVGTPRLVNPLIAVSDTDRDISALVYSGLMKATPDGTLQPDLAEGYDVSDDGLTYTFALRDGLTFQDGTPVTADDIVFTVERAQDPALKSPLRSAWEGVKAVAVDARHVQFTLKHAYAPFIENTTLGILPKHLWKNLTPEEFSFSSYNIDPVVGTGPYQFSRLELGTGTSDGRGGLPLSYTLVPFKEYVGGEAYLSTLVFRFYPNDDALFAAYSKGEIAAVSAIPADKAAELGKSGAHIERAPSFRIFGFFFNQGQNPIFARKEIRQALDMALDKQQIVAQVLKGYGTVASGPIPAGALPDSPALSSASTTASLASKGSASGQAAAIAAPQTGLDAAKALLAKNGWVLNASTNTLEHSDKAATKAPAKQQSKNGKLPILSDGSSPPPTSAGKLSLSFTISTSNVPELRQAAEMAKADWEKLGAHVNLKVFEPGDLQQNAIRPRSYDALLFGEIVGRDLDLYAFWHSSQRLDPGINIALYANPKVDKLLEKERVETDQAARIELLRQAEKAIADDVPAAFLYSPDYLYLVPQDLKDFAIGPVTVAPERFAAITLWHTESDRVWKFFAPGFDIRGTIERILHINQ